MFMGFGDDSPVTPIRIGYIGRTVRIHRGGGSMRATILAALLLTTATARAEAVKPADDVAKEAGDKFDYAAWDKLLKAYVDGKGRVDYARLRASATDRRELEKLYAQVAA